MTGRTVIANWKMNCPVESIDVFLRAICDYKVPSLVTVICPPAPYLQSMVARSDRSPLLFGGQNCSSEISGAFTGEVSPQMLKDVGCQYVILGHSERRQYYGETNELVNKKLNNALLAGLIPICCVGETREERRKNSTREVICNQVDALFSNNKISEYMSVSSMLIAYEPIWAIGTGESASPQQAREVHLLIKERVAKNAPTVAERVRVLYGGSVNDKNARGFFALDDVDGALIGGASLDAKSFNAIRRLAVET